MPASPASEAEQQRVVRDLMEKLGVAESDLVETSYEGLLRDRPTAGSRDQKR